MSASLSPRAESARREGQARDRAFWPTLARTQTRAIVWPPSARAYRDGPAARGFSAWMKASLPGFSLNARRGWWEAPLARLGEASEALGRRSGGFNVSRGAQEYLEKARGHEQLASN